MRNALHPNARSGIICTEDVRERTCIHPPPYLHRALRPLANGGAPRLQLLNRQVFQHQPAFRVRQARSAGPCRGNGAAAAGCWMGCCGGGSVRKTADRGRRAAAAWFGGRAGRCRNGGQAAMPAASHELCRLRITLGAPWRGRRKIGSWLQRSGTGASAAALQHCVGQCRSGGSMAARAPCRRAGLRLLQRIHAAWLRLPVQIACRDARHGLSKAVRIVGLGKTPYTARNQCQLII